VPAETLEVRRDGEGGVPLLGVAHEEVLEVLLAHDEPAPLVDDFAHLERIRALG
jgi:hypothetical protein